MSAGPRIGLSTAAAAAGYLTKAWGLDALGAVWVGSLRRGEASIGDLDLIAPIGGAKDSVYVAIDRTLERTGDMFGAESKPLCRALRGHKPGFLAASYVLLLDEPRLDLPLQVSRYTPENFGWQLVYRTGPRAFGMWFLASWKKRFGIPPDGNALVKDHLRDDHGRIVPVRTEEEAFRAVGWGFVPPGHRTAACVEYARASEWMRRVIDESEEKA